MIDLNKYSTQVTSSVSRRAGLSLMEVMFSIGILLIGIVGLAHVLPVGLHQSTDAISADKTLMAMENLVSKTIVEANTANAVIADRWAPTNSGGRQNYISYQPSADDFRFGVCVDPWFVTAAFNKRNPDTTALNYSRMNGYDRTWFPCYDRCYNPLVSPAAALYNGSGEPTTAWLAKDLSTPLPHSGPWPTWAAFAAYPSPLIAPGAPRFWSPSIGAPGFQAPSPRFLRIAPTSSVLSSIPRYASERAAATQSAEAALNRPKDKTQPAGRLFNFVGTVPANAAEVGRYSAASYIVSHEEDPNTLRVSTAVFRNRIPVIDPGGADGEQKFPLVPYTYSEQPNWSASTGPYYEGEQLGFVTSADLASFASGLAGHVEIVFHRAPLQPVPKFKRGQYIMLMRHVFSPSDLNLPDSSDPPRDYSSPQRLAFDWYRIADVVGDPTTDTRGKPLAATEDDPYHPGTSRDVWRITLDVRGATWIFDEESRITPGTYDYTPLSPWDATFAVWMPEVVGVHERTITLRGRQ